MDGPSEIEHAGAALLRRPRGLTPRFSRIKLMIGGIVKPMDTQITGMAGTDRRPRLSAVALVVQR